MTVSLGITVLYCSLGEDRAIGKEKTLEDLPLSFITLGKVLL